MTGCASPEPLVQYKQMLNLKVIVLVCQHLQCSLRRAFQSSWLQLERMTMAPGNEEAEIHKYSTCTTTPIINL